MDADSNQRRSKRSNNSENPSPSKLEIVQNAILAPFVHRRHDSSRIFSDLAPVIMTPKMINHASTVNARSKPPLTIDHHKMDFATLGRAPMSLTIGRRVTSRDLQIVEDTQELLEQEVPEPTPHDVSLLRGFNATIPSSEKNKTRRRQLRHVHTPKLGLKKLGMNARGIMAEDTTTGAGGDPHNSEELHSVASDDDVVIVSKADAARRRRRTRESLSAAKLLGKDELKRQTQEIRRDKENLHVRRSLANNQIDEVARKIEALEVIRANLEQDLIRIHEEELELDDELEGVQERLEFEQGSTSTSKSNVPPHFSKKRRGPAFLPSEHDDLPPGVAFMTLESHTTPICALDFSEPYGTLVSASRDDPHPRVWDLFSGTEVGRLRGHQSTVKCLQVEDQLCLTGGQDGDVRLWDLRLVEDGEWSDVNGAKPSSSAAAEEEEKVDPCMRVLQGHTKAVTALYFEEECLVTGASDKTLRQWDLSTGQCVMTMDLLWAISHPSTTMGSLGPTTPSFVGGSSWDEGYEDFVGAVQFWGYGLVSGSGDGVVRMWDMRTGQSHRMLHGHTAPITCLQFDELHVVTGSLDKTIRIWDLRMDEPFETLQYDHPVTDLQFDSRKVVSAVGENGIKIYNRTSGQHSTLITNGHTLPVQKLQFMDKYLVSGGRDAMLKIWSL